MDRYEGDVLAPGWRRAGRPVATPVAMEVGMVVEEGLTGFCGAVVRWDNGLVVLEDRGRRRRSFPIGPGFLLDGKPVELQVPRRAASARRTASGSRVGPTQAARQALPSRIYVEGRHDAELVEKIWGDDLRHVGVVVEYLEGIDDLVAVVDAFAPEPGRRLGILVDHLVPGSKESRIVERVSNGRYGPYVFVTGHAYVDIWAAVAPDRVGLAAWPDVPRGREYKHGLCAALGLPSASQADVAAAWRLILSRVTTWEHLDRRLVTEVEKLIDFVTQDHPQ